MRKKSIQSRAPLEKRDINLNEGLTAEQIAERETKGYINEAKIGGSKSVWAIFSENVFTFFNLLCLLVFIWIITVAESINDYKNATFMGIIAINIAIGVIQELKAKHTMDKLSLLSSPDVKVIREGRQGVIKLNRILTDDIVLLEPGDQICSDSILVEGTLEVNESLLTGESMPIKKETGDTLLSGSYVITGKGKSRVDKIGEENYIQQIALKAKELKKNQSELIKSIKLIMRVIGVVIIPLAVLSFLNNYNAQLMELNKTSGVIEAGNGFLQALKFRDAFAAAHTAQEMSAAYKQAVFSTAGGVIGMIPVGMFLLTSVALAVGVLRLYKKKAVVRELYSIETLARVNMLCLDKTGTITDGTMNVSKVIDFACEKKGYPVGDIIASMQAALDENNQTAIALKNYFRTDNIINAVYTIAFSSERKASAVYFEEIGLCALGAPEYIGKSLPQKVQGEIERYQQRGYRCLLLGLAKNKADIDARTIPDNCAPLALIIIEDNIKPNAAKTIAKFKENGVDVRVISGDNPQTVAEVAKRVGIENAYKYISLQNLSDAEIRTLAMDYTVFGRVNPAQKKLLISIFKENGKTVAMTGDGVNDILALKEADCSVAMANGAEATRNIAQLVLMDSDFGSMPAIVNEGRRVINNVQRSSSLFLTKTLFSFLLLIGVFLLKLSYPFEPVQLTFTNLFVIGIASFVLALEPNKNRIKGKFINNILKNIIPPALSMVVSILIIVLLKEKGLLNVSQGEYDTIITYTFFGNFMLVLYNVSRPFNLTRTILIITILLLAAGCAIIMPLLPNQDLNMFNLYRLESLLSVTLILSLIFLADNVIKAVDYIIKRIKGKPTGDFSKMRLVEGPDDKDYLDYLAYLNQAEAQKEKEE
ncbi:MAG: HAD-IC family P-type ATPase [Christensenellales bacterium]|jgi:cation-transporting ATPase E